jgi:NDP-sugar pyrophosphorylase family protein
VVWSDDGPERRGTGGAIRLAADRGLLDDEFAVLYGDSYLPIDVHAPRNRFREAALPALMVVHRNDGRWDTSNVVYSEGLVERYEKNVDDPSMHHIDYGLSWFRRSAVEDLVPGDRPTDLADTFTALAATGLLAGYEVGERFFEIGSPTGLADLERHLRRSGRSTVPDPG